MRRHLIEKEDLGHIFDAYEQTKQVSEANRRTLITSVCEFLINNYGLTPSKEIQQSARDILVSFFPVLNAVS